MPGAALVTPRPAAAGALGLRETPHSRTTRGCVWLCSQTLPGGPWVQAHWSLPPQVHSLPPGQCRCQNPRPHPSPDQAAGLQRPSEEAALRPCPTRLEGGYSHMLSWRTKLAMLLCLKYFGNTSLANCPWSNTWKLFPLCWDTRGGVTRSWPGGHAPERWAAQLPARLCAPYGRPSSQSGSPAPGVRGSQHTAFQTQSLG